MACFPLLIVWILLEILHQLIGNNRYPSFELFFVLLFFIGLLRLEELFVLPFEQIAHCFFLRLALSFVGSSYLHVNIGIGYFDVVVIGALRKQDRTLNRVRRTLKMNVPRLRIITYLQPLHQHLLLILGQLFQVLAFLKFFNLLFV